MRTYIYVDGFNFYYGRLRGTRYKWVDLYALFGNLLVGPHDIQRINYFTAIVNPSRAGGDPDVRMRQQTYLRALESLPAVKVHLGKFNEYDNRMPKAAPPHQLVRVIKTEEKQSDVNLAVHLVNDAWKDRYDCAVVVSDDTDMAGAMKLIRQEFPSKKLGLVSPRARPEGRDMPPSPGRPWFSAELYRYARFRLMIDDSHLAASQFPNPVTRPNRDPISKPASW